METYKTSDSPLRIKLGITGHRRLPDEAILSERIAQVLKKEIFELIGESRGRAAFTLLTPLAEGADRLAAREVLKFPDSKIEAVLPLTKEEYMEDFETEESHREFEELLSRSEKIIKLKSRRLREEYPEGDLTNARNLAYEDVGRYVADHCDVLIALWDGDSSRGKGGTAEIVEYTRKKNRPLIIISTIPPYAVSVEKGSNASFH